MITALCWFLYQKCDHLYPYFMIAPLVTDWVVIYKLVASCF